MYKKILVASDLATTKNDPVIERMAKLMPLFDAEWHLISVVERILAYGNPPFPQNVSEWQEEFVSVAKKKLKALAQAHTISEDHLYAPVGSPKEEIIEKADDIDADLILIGSHTRKGLSYMLLGSTADGVVQASKCDVLVVRAPSE